jgi:hypothetical protein
MDYKGTCVKAIRVYKVAFAALDFNDKPHNLLYVTVPPTTAAEMNNPNP